MKEGRGNPSVRCGGQLPLHSSHRLSSSSCAGVVVGIFSDSAPTHLRCAGVPLGLFGKPKRSSFSRVRGLHQAILWPLLQNARPSVALRPAKGSRGQPLSLLRQPAPPFAPKRPFGTFRCCGRLIFRKEYTVLFSPKRSTFNRFAACEREPRVTPQSAAAASSPYAGEPRVTPQSAAAASSPYILRTDSALRAAPVLWSAYFPIPHRPTFGAPVFRSAYSASRNARASAAFAASIKPYYGLCSKTLDLQPLCGLRKGAEGNPSVCCGDNSP